MTQSCSPRIWVGSNPEPQPEYILFNGGEPYVKLPPQEWLVPIVHARPSNVTDWLFLLHLLDAMHQEGYDLGLWEMRIGYFPGSRQDRYQHGVPFSLKVYADQLNLFNLGTVRIYDPHSYVTPALINNAIVEPQPLIPDHPYYEAFVAPDAGAQHKTQDYLARFIDSMDLDFNPLLLQGFKHRDPRTGNLTGFSIDSQSVLPALALIVDDICDGGGTFLGLADAFYDTYRELDLSLMSLYVTHGIFAYGTEELSKRFSCIYSTTSFMNKSDLENLGVEPVPLYPDEPDCFWS